MMTTDKSNYGTPLSYATENQDNEITFTDYSGFVFAIKGILKKTLNLLYIVSSLYGPVVVLG